MKKGCVLASIALAACLSASSVCAAAGDNEGGAAAAESLFQEARKAMDAKRYSEACPKFLASHKLAPAIGTLLNLADCYEKNNQLASAWARFHEAIAMAQRQNRANREATARERADKLESRLIKLSINSKEKAQNLEVSLDGNKLDPAALGTPIPVDAGKHSLEASAKGKKTFTTTVEVSETKNKTPSVEIPPLEDAPAEKTEGGGKIAEPPKERPKGWTGQKTLGVVAASVGVVGLGVGGFFGLRTSSQWKDAQSHCTGNECDQTGVNLAEQAKSSGNIATISAIAGGALLIGGAVLFFTAGDGGGSAGTSKTPIRVGIGPGSLVLGGTFQ